MAVTIRQLAFAQVTAMAGRGSGAGQRRGAGSSGVAGQAAGGRGVSYSVSSYWRVWRATFPNVNREGSPSLLPPWWTSTR